MVLDNRKVLITGGTGSLGQTVVQRILAGEMGTPASITVFSRDEAKQHYMRLSYLNRTVATDEVIYQNFGALLKFRIGDIRDYPSVLQAVHEADVIIHAAAMKQVPTCEYFPFQAIQTNVLGTQNLVRAVSETSGSVETVVAISTDKACKPINVMGMTKALAERVIIQANVDCPGTRFLCVRYGNVIASRGSVVPLFLDQIEAGGPVTVTTPDMTRFLLSLDQAVDTVFAAIRHGFPGEIFVPKVAAARIMDLARTLVNGRDIPMVVTGIRPGEKIHEMMVSEEEVHRTTERAGYYVICPMLPELSREAGKSLTLAGPYSSSNVTLGDSELRELLVPFINGTAREVAR